MMHMIERDYETNLRYASILLTEGKIDDMMNIVNGRLGPSSINVHKAIEIGRVTLQEFERTWPAGFYDTIPKKVTNMTVTKQYVRVGEVKVIDTGLIYSRVIGLQASSRDVDVNDVFSHELAPIPTSLLTEVGEMSISKAKSVLKK